MPATEAMLITEDYINSPGLIILSLTPIKLGKIPLELLWPLWFKSYKCFQVHLYLSMY